MNKSLFLSLLLSLFCISVFSQNNTDSIVEVKTRSTDYFEVPEEAINLRKIRNLVNAAHEYIFSCNWEGETRFDVISVIPIGQSFKIDHIEDAFMPPMN